MNKPIIYQMLPRLWGNNTEAPVQNGSIKENGTGKFSDIDKATLDYLKWLGCSHVWYTGIIRHSTSDQDAAATPSHPQFVKGQAGSPYAICDYYDVNHYLADNPKDRMHEFKELINRTHKAGLKVIIDFVPNHVSRDYGKVDHTEGRSILGADDDKTVHWKESNDFYYYPSEALTLPTPCPAGMAPYNENPAMATGNNCFCPSPGINDWYETIKINYCNYYTSTWQKMYEIVDYWAGLGIDGFRCDMVELVPPQFFKWLIHNIKEKYPDIIFIAEVYQKDRYEEYIKNVGFDYLYDKSGIYDTIRSIVELSQPASAITGCWQYLSELQPHMLNFLENHDEQRFASEFFGKDKSRTFASLSVALLMNTAAFMIYFGEEVGERGMDSEGFSGIDGRTTIFDWWSIDSVRKLRKIIKDKSYRSLDKDTLIRSGLSEDEAEYFIRFASALRFASSDMTIQNGEMYDLGYCNTEDNGFYSQYHYAFLRNHNGHTLLVAANFASEKASIKISIPKHAFEWMNIPITETMYPEVQIPVQIDASDAVIVELN